MWTLYKLLQSDFAKQQTEKSDENFAIKVK